MEEKVSNKPLLVSRARVCYLCVIEFQERHLPHAHILLTLRNEVKNDDCNRIDRIVFAEVPILHPTLFELVGEHDRVPKKSSSYYVNIAKSR